VSSTRPPGNVSWRVPARAPNPWEGSTTLIAVPAPPGAMRDPPKQGHPGPSAAGLGSSALRLGSGTDAEEPEICPPCLWIEVTKPCPEASSVETFPRYTVFGKGLALSVC